ncbi:MAG: RDD family protein [Cellvibrionaceae bacterium]|nr:RDD family protein [Cellvibrionaceae bacterium]
MESPKYAGFWIRLVAHIVDGFVFSLIIVPLALWLVDFDLSRYSEQGSGTSIVRFVLPMLAVWLFWYYKSATPGKMIFRIKIVDAQTLGRLGIGQTIGRYFAYMVCIIPLFLGFIWVAFDPRKQGFHDKLAGTLVIIEEPKQNENG